MSSDDPAIERLYQLPLGEFTAARNALAKESGTASIKTLVKPSLPAWAVNQLFWRQRKAFDRVSAAAERVRTAHAQLLTGKAADVTAAETAHQAAIKTALDEVRGILKAAGEVESPATTIAVQETLQALPGDEPPGQFTKPLKLKGFEALAGIVPASGLRAFKILEPRASSPAPARVAKAAPTAAEAAAEKRAADARRKEADQLAADLRDAKAAEKQAATAADRARTARDAAQQEHAQLTKKLDGLTLKLRELSDGAHRAEKDAAKAVSDRERLEFRLAAVREAK